MTETQQLQSDYFAALDAYLVGSEVEPSTSGKKNYRRFDFHKAYCHLDALIQIDDQVLQVGLRMKSTDRDAVFKRLRANQAEIEDDIGMALVWDAKKRKKQCWIYAEKEADPTDWDDWPEQHRWIRSMLERFLTAFSSYV